MLSRNLVKQMFMTIPQEENKRVIDNNALIRKRIGISSAPEGFVSGLAAEVVEVSGDDEGANIIKAREDVDALMEQAREDAEAILSDARTEAIHIREDARAQANIEKNQILAQAHQQGYEDGRSQAQEQVAAIEREYQEKARQLEAEYQQQIDVLEPQFIDTITGIYEQVFHVDLGSYREVLVHLISAAIRRLEGNHEFMIHVSKEDYPYVSMQKKQALAGAVSAGCSIDVVEDSTLNKNECMIETEGGIYDCGLDTQMTELRRRLQLLSWSQQ